MRRLQHASHGGHRDDSITEVTKTVRPQRSPRPQRSAVRSTSRQRRLCEDRGRSPHKPVNRRSGLWAIVLDPRVAACSAGRRRTALVILVSFVVKTFLWFLWLPARIELVAPWGHQQPSPRREEQAGGTQDSGCLELHAARL